MSKRHIIVTRKVDDNKEIPTLIHIDAIKTVNPSNRGGDDFFWMVMEVAGQSHKWRVKESPWEINRLIKNLME